jgi:16S rRNA processing protein RimM
VLRTQGRHGEVAAELHTGSVERFRSLSRVLALDRHDRRRELRLENFWSHKGLVVLKFQGVDSISQGETLVACEIQVPRGNRFPLQSGEVYVSDLIDCEIFNREAHVGRVADVQFGSGDAPLLVVKSGRKECLIPFAEAFLVSLDLDGKRIEMQLPEGMVELND